MTRYEEAVQAELARQTELYNADAANGAPLSAPPNEDMIRATYSFLRETPLIMEPSPALDLARAIYRIAGGRLYSVERQAFLDAAPESDSVIDLMDGGQPASVEYLRQTLEFYRLPAGDCLLDLEDLRSRKLDELAVAFEEAAKNATVMSSAGFEIDANEKANRDLEGLITGMTASGAKSVTFCAADNSFHEVTLEQLKTMRLEVIASGQRLYARKWGIREAIGAAQDRNSLMAIGVAF